MHTYEAELCDCCIIAAFNNDTTGHEVYCGEQVPEPLSWLEDGHVVIGDDPDSRGFSRLRCDGCGQRLYGDRTTCVVEDRTKS